MGRRSRSIQGNGDVRVCVQGSGRTSRRGASAGRSCRARLTPFAQSRPSTPPVGGFPASFADQGSLDPTSRLVATHAIPG
jgi:hypothetical protein